MGAIRARVAAVGLLALLIWQTGVAARAEWQRVSPEATAAALTAGLEQRYRATIGAHHTLLSAVWTHAPDVRRLIVVRDAADARVLPPGPPEAPIERRAPEDLLVPHLTTLLFPVAVRDLPGLVADATHLAELLDPTTYVLDLRSDGALVQRTALAPVAAGEGYALLRYDPSR